MCVTSIQERGTRLYMVANVSCPSSCASCVINISAAVTAQYLQYSFAASWSKLRLLQAARQRFQASLAKTPKDFPKVQAVECIELDCMVGPLPRHKLPAPSVPQRQR